MKLRNFSCNMYAGTSKVYVNQSKTQRIILRNNGIALPPVEEILGDIFNKYNFRKEARDYLGRIFFHKDCETVEEGQAIVDEINSRLVEYDYDDMSEDTYYQCGSCGCLHYTGSRCEEND